MAKMAGRNCAVGALAKMPDTSPDLTKTDAA